MDCESIDVVVILDCEWCLNLLIRAYIKCFQTKNYLYVYLYIIISQELSKSNLFAWQASCREVTRGPSRDCRWAAGLNMVDQDITDGRIIAYKIRWFNGRWSGWFVPGVNDLDIKYNSSGRSCSVPYKANTLRRRWSNFYDHRHKYVVCKLK